MSGGEGNHLPPVLPAPAAGLCEGDQGGQGGALSEAHEGCSDPADNGKRGRDRGCGVIRWVGVGGAHMSNIDGGQNGQSVEPRSRVGQQGYPGYWGLGSQQAGRMARQANSLIQQR